MRQIIENLGRTENQNSEFFFLKPLEQEWDQFLCEDPAGRQNLTL